MEVGMGRATVRVPPAIPSSRAPSMVDSEAIMITEMMAFVAPCSLRRRAVAVWICVCCFRGEEMGGERYGISTYDMIRDYVWSSARNCT
jgi:hypothetical protein